MSLIAKKEGGDFDFQICPAGNHVATCISVVDLGVQEVNFQGTISYKRKVRVSWELPNELIQEGNFSGQPFSVSKNYTLSLNEKAILFKDLTSWRGRAFTQQELDGFDLYNILGVNCMLNVVHVPSQDGPKTYANVASVSQMPKGMNRIQNINPLLSFNTEEYTPEQWDSLPEWLQNKINIPQPKQAEPTPQIGYDAPQMTDDDIPF